MKKLICLFSAIALIFTSCSSDDAPTPIPTPVDTSGILVTRIIETYEDNSTYTTEYVYSGTKIVSATDSDDEYQIFTYTGDLINKIEHFLSDDDLYQVDTYTYDSNDKLTSFVSVFPNDTNLGSRETYTYNPNGTISVNYYSGDYTTQTNLDNTAILTLSNGEVSQLEFTSGRTLDFTYDDKNIPWKNVTGIGKLSITNALPDGVDHNTLSIIDSESFESATYSYIYNTNNFPSNSTDIIDSETITTQYFYNQ